MATSEFVISGYWITIDQPSEYADYPGENMGFGYDIFREASDGSPLWVEQAATLKEAEEQLETLARTVPAKYLIRDAASTKIVGRAGPNISLQGLKPTWIPEHGRRS